MAFEMTVLKKNDTEMLLERRQSQQGIHYDHPCKIFVQGRDLGEEAGSNHVTKIFLTAGWHLFMSNPKTLTI